MQGLQVLCCVFTELNTCPYVIIFLCIPVIKYAFYTSNKFRTKFQYRDCTILRYFCSAQQINFSSTINEERWLQVFENGLLRKVFASKRDGVTQSIEDYITSNFMICTGHQTLLRWSNKQEEDGWGMWNMWETVEVHTGFWRGDLTERKHLEDLGVCGRTI